MKSERGQADDFILEIDLLSMALRYGGQSVQVQSRYLPFLKLVASRSLAQKRTDRRIHVSEVRELEVFRHLSEKVLGQTIYRFLNDEKSGFNARIRGIRGAASGGLIVSPERKAKEVWELHQPWVTQVLIRAEDSERQTEDLRMSPAHLLSLLRLEVMLERGNAAGVLAALPDLTTVPDDAVAGQAALLRCQAFEQLERWNEALSELDRARVFLRDAPTNVQLRWRLQQARLERLVGEPEEAGHLLRSLWADLPPHETLLRGRLELLEGLLILDDSKAEPRSALPHFHRAAQHYLDAHWLWGLGQLHANIGLTYLKQSRHPLSQSAALKTQALQAGRDAFLEALACGEVLQRPAETGVLTLLAHIERELGEAAQAHARLTQVLSAPLSPREEGEARMEQAELDWQQGRRDEAREQWSHALHLSLEPGVLRGFRLRIGDRLPQVQD